MVRHRRDRLVQSPCVRGDAASSASAAQPGSRTLPPGIRWAGALLFALLVSDARSLTLPASLLVLCAGGAVWLAGRYAAPASTADGATVSRVGVTAWAAVFLTFALWEL